MRRVLFVLGTRPEAIKLCPVVRHFRLHAPDIDTRVCVTAQHRELLDQVLAIFAVEPDHDLAVMTPGQTLAGMTARILEGLAPVIAREQPSMIVVQGDTTTTLCGALAGFYARIPVGHVEAGLRTGDMSRPFPEELNRVLTGRMASLHFAATEGARRQLREEGVADGAIVVTGNPGIDAVLHVGRALDEGRLRASCQVPGVNGRKLILVTAHRRESFGEGLASICTALSELSLRGDAEIVYPVHPNPNVRSVVESQLRGLDRLHLIEPLDYVGFVDLMRRASILLTDSGGIQEEGPALGKPVLVMRDKTERQEAVDAGAARLVGTDPERIVAEVSLLLGDAEEYERRSAVHSPYGDGSASARILAATRSFLGK
jgi:UDP-N-acetylglucosamine 2-epimerase (non-hydrolysing)